MYILINTADNSIIKYPYTIEEFRAQNPNVSLPTTPTEAQLNEVGIYNLIASQPPTCNINQKVISTTPIKINNDWTEQWQIVDQTQEELNGTQIAIYHEIVLLTQKRLDDFAKTRNYDGILSACTYATSTVPKFQIEGQYCVDARDSTWNALYTILAEVQAGTRAMPTGFADVLPLLPTLTWPN